MYSTCIVLYWQMVYKLWGGPIKRFLFHKCLSLSHGAFLILSPPIRPNAQRHLDKKSLARVDDTLRLLSNQLIQIAFHTEYPMHRNVSVFHFPAGDQIQFMIIYQKISSLRI